MGISFKWRGWVPEVCDECGQRTWLSWYTPSLWRDRESALSTVWHWAFWWGPLHLHRTVAEKDRLRRLAEYNDRRRVCGGDWDADR